MTIPPAGHVAALTEAGLPRAFAEAAAEPFAAFAAGRVAPQGGRTLIGMTTIDDVLPRLLTMESRVSVPDPGPRM